MRLLTEEDIKEIINDVLFDNGVISKEFYEKCSRNKISSNNPQYQIRLNKKVRKVIDNFTEEVKGDKKEHVLIFDEEGNIVFKKDGTKNGIDLTNEEEEYLNSLEDNKYITMHNHPVHEFNPDVEGILGIPDYSSNLILDSEVRSAWKSKINPVFSFSDVESFVDDRFNKISIVVSSDNGSRMILSKTDDYINQFNEEGRDSKFYRNIKNTYSFLISDEFDSYVDDLRFHTANIIRSDIRVNDKVIMKEIISKMPDDVSNPELYILNEYEKRGFEEAGSFEDTFIPVRERFNQNGVDLSIEY